MVRKGSPVRVRHWAPKESPAQAGFFVRREPSPSGQLGLVGNGLGNTLAVGATNGRAAPPVLTGHSIRPRRSACRESRRVGWRKVRRVAPARVGTSRRRGAKAGRTPYALVLDEAQVASETSPALLAGARAFGLGAVCGAQSGAERVAETAPAEARYASTCACQAPLRRSTSGSATSCARPRLQAT